MNFQNLPTEKKCLLRIFLVILLLFFASLTIWVGVKIVNEIKGRGIEVQNTITVSATGEIYAKPDLALTTFSTITEAKTVTEALSQNTEKMNGIINFLKEKGIAEKDLKTTSFNIYPRYEWHKNTEIYPYPEGERVLVGYEVRQSLEVKIRDIGKIGEIIQGTTDAGANQIGDLQFTIDNQEELKKQAREEAIDKVKSKAKEMASQLGVKLVRITNFSESGVVPVYYGLEKAGLGMGGGEAAPQIETGENKIEITVSITYEIN